MKGIILYTSKYGATKHYAEWLKEETGFDCIETKKADIETVRQYDTVILGGGIYATKIAGLGFLKKHMDALKGKKIIVFCDGASPYDEKAFSKTVAYNMKDSLKGIPCFYLRGGWDLNTMTFTDKTACKMLIKSLSRKKIEDCEVWEKALLEAGYNKCDWTDRASLGPVLDEIGS